MSQLFTLFYQNHVGTIILKLRLIQTCLYVNVCIWFYIIQPDFNVILIYLDYLWSMTKKHFYMCISSKHPKNYIIQITINIIAFTYEAYFHEVCFPSPLVVSQ